MKIRLKGSILFSDGEGAMLSRTRLKASWPSLATVTSADGLAEYCLCHAELLTIDILQLQHAENNFLVDLVVLSDQNTHFSSCLRSCHFSFLHLI